MKLEDQKKNQKVGGKKSQNTPPNRRNKELTHTSAGIMKPENNESVLIAALRVKAI